MVVDSASQRPIPAVPVSLADGYNRNLQRFLTDATGEFQFLTPRPGRYSVHAERPGMNTETGGLEWLDWAQSTGVVQGHVLLPGSRVAGDTVSLKLVLVQLPLDRLVEEVGRIVDLSDREPPPEGDVGRGSASESGIARAEGGGDTPVRKITLQLPRGPSSGGR